MNRLTRSFVVMFACITMALVPAVVSADHPGDGHCDNGVGNGADCRPGSAHFSNDDHGGTIGSPGVDCRTEYTSNERGNNQIIGDGGDC